MLLLLTIALVLVAAITLLIGIIGDSLLLIFVSIFCSLGAGATLLVLSSASKKRARETAPAAAGPAPLESTPSAYAALDDVEPAVTVVRAAPAPVVEEAPVAATEPALPRGFPIDGYDDLKVSEIMPLLDELDLDQLDMVLEREENNKKRATVMTRVNELMDRLEAEEEATGTRAADTLEPAIPVGGATATSPAAAAAAVGNGFPIGNYDRLSADEILDRLPELDDDELELVYEREDAGAGRTAILDRVDEILDEREGVGSPAAGQSEEAAEVTQQLEAVPAKKVTAKKVAAKKVAAKKVTATKVAAKKVAAAPKRAPAKKAAAAAKAPVKKAPVKKAAVKKAAVKKAAVKKAAAPAKAPAKKAPAKKAAAKKAAKKAR